MLSVEGVSKAYPTPRGPLPVLEDVSFTLEPGGSLCVVGPSGSGKSTLLYILGTLERPSAGRVRMDGRDLQALSEPELAAFRNREVGFVFQDHFLLPQLSVLENVLAPTLVAAKDPEHPRRGYRKGLSDDPARTSNPGTVDGLFRNSKSKGPRPDCVGGQAHSDSR